MLDLGGDRRHTDCSSTIELLAMNIRSTSRLLSVQISTAMALVVAAIGASSAMAQTNLKVAAPSDATGSDSFFYTIYEKAGADIQWLTCGHDAQSSGCYGSGTLGTFGRACSVVGGSTRVIVADAFPGGKSLTLNFYKQVESSTPSATLKKKLALPALPASATAACHMAILGDFLYVGTNESPTAYKVNTKTYELATLSGCGGNTSAITAGDQFAVVSMSGCMMGFDKLGNAQISGGEFEDYFAPGTNGFAP